MDRFCFLNKLLASAQPRLWRAAQGFCAFPGRAGAVVAPLGRQHAGVAKEWIVFAIAYYSGLCGLHAQETSA